MHPIYATRVDVWPPDPSNDGQERISGPFSNGSDVRTHVTRRAAAWAAELIARVDPGARVMGETVADLSLEGGAGRCRIEAEAFDNAAGSAWRLAIETLGREGNRQLLGQRADRSAPAEPSWRVDMTGRAAGEAVVLTVRIAADAGTPADVVAVPPTLIADLCKSTELGVRGEAVRSTPHVCEADGIDDLVGWLLGTERTLPLVLVSRLPDERTVVSAVALAERLATLAHVVELGSFGTAFALTESVGKLFSCYNGAVRLYWPGLTLDDDPYAHPLSMAEWLARAPRAPERLLADPIVAQAAQRIGPDRAVAPIEAEERRRRRMSLTRPTPADESTEAASNPSAASAPPDAVHAAALRGTPTPPSVAEAWVGASAVAPGPASPHAAQSALEASSMEPPTAEAPPADPNAGRPPAMIASATGAPADGAPVAEAPPTASPTAESPAGAPDAAPRDWNARLHALAAQLDTLTAMYGEDVDRMEKRIDELEDVIRELRQTPGVTVRERAEPIPAASARGEPARRSFATVAMAAEVAAQEFSGAHLVFHANAFHSARASDFARPNDIFAALEDVAEVARKYHDNDGLKGGFKAAFEELGQTYKADVSPTTLGKHGDAYTFPWKEQRVVAGPHIGVGGPKSRVGWRIYWYVDEQDRAFVICHVGRHLPYAGNS